MYILHNNILVKKDLFYDNTVYILHRWQLRTNFRKIKKFSTTKKRCFPILHCSTYQISVSRIWTMFLYWEQFSRISKNSLFQNFYFLKRVHLKFTLCPWWKTDFWYSCHRSIIHPTSILSLPFVSQVLIQRELFSILLIPTQQLFNSSLFYFAWVILTDHFGKAIIRGISHLL